MGEQTIGLGAYQSGYHAVWSKFTAEEHGLRIEDISTGRDKQNVDSAVRMCGPVCSAALIGFDCFDRISFCLSFSLSPLLSFLQKFRACLSRLPEFETNYLATSLFTLMVHEFYQATQDPGLSYIAVVEKLAFVVIFNRHWNRWVQHKKLNANQARLTPQTCLHLQIAAHAVINLLGYWKDFHLSTSPPYLKHLVSSLLLQVCDFAAVCGY